MAEEEKDDFKGLPGKPLSASFVDAEKDLFERKTNNTQNSESFLLNVFGDEEVLLQPGKKFYHYNIEKKIGSGGMGEVFLALDLAKNRKVAIKTLKVKSGRASERFRREYEFLSKVDHPNLIKAYDFRESDKELFLVMEFVQGQSLKELIEKGNDYTFTDKVAVACQIAAGVQALNLVGIIHRDIKPANIMVDSAKGIVKILDLGLSKDAQKKFSEKLTKSNQILGTCLYMAPEQTEGQVTVTTDVFALGAVLWEWFSGSKESPFFADNQFGILMMILTHEPMELIEFFPKKDALRNIYQHLSNMVTKAMCKEPAQRIPHVKIITDTLMKIQQQLASQRLASLHKWQQISLTPSMQQSFEQSASMFGDKDVSLPGEIHLSEIIEKSNLSPTHTDKLPRLVRHKKTFRYKEKSNKLRNFIIIIILIIGSVVMISSVDRFLQIPQQQIQKQIGEAEKLQELVAAEKDTFGKILQKYWLKEEMCFDFSHEDWGKLNTEQQVQNATAYQQWYAKVKDTTVEKKITVNNATFEMMLIPPGKFWMGSPVTETGRHDNETRHKVWISKAFWLAKNEVTQKQWREVIEPWKKHDKEYHWEKYKIYTIQDETHPATLVPWDSIHDVFFKAANDSKLKLPTEAQWEYACRGGTTSRFYWGDNAEKDQINSISYWLGYNFDDYTVATRELNEKYLELLQINNIYINSKILSTNDQQNQRYLVRILHQNKIGTTSVQEMLFQDKRNQNPFGLYDMLGNAHEWCADTYDYDFYKNSPEQDPVYKTSPMPYVVFRGGAWNSGFFYCRSAYRHGYKPSAINMNIGFRLSSLFE